MSTLPPCPKCQSEYVYQDQLSLVCPECAFEWNPDDQEEDQDQQQIQDANGTALQEGDKITLAKDLKVKGSSLILKIALKGLLSASMIKKIIS